MMVGREMGEVEESKEKIGEMGEAIGEGSTGLVVGEGRKSPPGAEREERDPIEGQRPREEGEEEEKVNSFGEEGEMVGEFVGEGREEKGEEVAQAEVGSSKGSPSVIDKDGEREEEEEEEEEETGRTAREVDTMEDFGKRFGSFVDKDFDEDDRFPLRIPPPPSTFSALTSPSTLSIAAALATPSSAAEGATVLSHHFFFV